MYEEGAPDRIRWFLEAFRGAPASWTVPQGVAEIFGWDLQSEAHLVYRAIANAVQADRATRAMIDAAPTDSNVAMILEHFNQVDAAVAALASPSSSTPYVVQQVVNKVLDTGWHALKIAPAILRAYSPQTDSMPDDTITSLLQETRELIDLVVAANDLAPDAKQTIVARLRDVETALLTYKVSGNPAVEGSRDALLGSLVASGSQWKQAPGGLQGRVGRLIVNLGLALSITASSFAIASHFEPSTAPAPAIVQVLNILELPAPQGQVVEPPLTGQIEPASESGTEGAQMAESETDAGSSSSAGA